MALTKKVAGSKPRDIATKLVDAFAVKFSGLFETPTIGGPGFINLKLTREYVNHQLKTILADTKRVGTSPPPFA